MELALGVAGVVGGLLVPTQQIAPGVLMPVVSIGTGGTERSAAGTIVTNWLGLGGRGIDTALMYQDQDVVAQAIRSAHVDRKSLFITSKIPGCSQAEASVQADLKALGTDYLDLLLIHFPQGDCSAAWAALEAFHAKGVLKAIGVSNFRKPELESLLKTAKVVPAVNQIQHNLLQHDDETIAFSRAHNITIEAYSPLGRDSGAIPKNAVVTAIASRHKVTAFQVALKWILQHGHVLTFQSSSAEHQQQDADLFSFSLTGDEMAQLDNLQTEMLHLAV